MSDKKVLEKVNIIKECRKLGLPLFECPHFIFSMMGILIILTSSAIYFTGFKYTEDPLLITLTVLIVSAVLFTMSFIITQGFEKLAEASRMKLEFLTIISHQMRAPFSNLRWVIELMKSGGAGKIDKKNEEYLDILKENSQRMEQLIERLIMVSKIEQNMMPLKKKKASFEKIIEKSILEFKAFAAASNVKVSFEKEDNFPEILIDPGQTREAVDNLLDNAIKYSKKSGKVKIKIYTKNKKAYFEIKDDGAGIPKSDQKYVFKKFFRSENALKNQTDGSGLGLFIVKSIIENHGGKITFESEEGKGTTFIFSLPIKK